MDRYYFARKPAKTVIKIDSVETLRCGYIMEIVSLPHKIYAQHSITIGVFNAEVDIIITTSHNQVTFKNSTTMHVYYPKVRRRRLYGEGFVFIGNYVPHWVQSIYS